MTQGMLRNTLFLQNATILEPIMSSSDDDKGGCLILILLFFMALRGCEHSEQNEKKINDLESKVESMETEINRMKHR
jgi:hypothetical protein